MPLNSQLKDEIIVDKVQPQEALIEEVIDSPISTENSEPVEVIEIEPIEETKAEEVSVENEPTEEKASEEVVEQEETHAEPSCYEKILPELTSSREEIAALKQTVNSLIESNIALKSSVQNMVKVADDFKTDVKIRLQKENELLREDLKHNSFNPILKKLASLYSTYYFMFDEEMDPKTKGNIVSILEQIREIIEDYDGELTISKENSPVNSQISRVITKVQTGNPELDKCVAQSLKPGFRKENINLLPEAVSMYVYDESLAVKEEVVTENNDADSVVSEEPAPSNEANTTENI